MAVPTLSSITPNTGHTGGRTLVELVGTNFKRLPPPPVYSSGFEPAQRPKPTVRVLFDGLPAERVEVVSSALIRCITPRHPPDRWVFQRTLDGAQVWAPIPAVGVVAPAGSTHVQVDFGTVDVVVQNIDLTGTLIPGEQATLPECYSFRRPRLDMAGTWFRALEQFAEILSIDVLENVVVSPNLDYDANTGDVRGFVEIAKTPGIGLTQVNFPASTELLDRAPGEEDMGGDRTLVRYPAVHNDIEIAIVVVSESKVELLAIAQILVLFFERNHELVLLRDPDDADHGQITMRYTVAPEGVQLTGRIGRTNTQTATLNIGIRALPTETMPGLTGPAIAGAPSWLPHDGTLGVTRPVKRFKSFRRAR